MQQKNLIGASFAEISTKNWKFVEKNFKKISKNFEFFHGIWFKMEFENGQSSFFYPRVNFSGQNQQLSELRPRPAAAAAPAGRGFFGILEEEPRPAAAWPRSAAATAGRGFWQPWFQRLHRNLLVFVISD